MIGLTLGTVTIAAFSPDWANSFEAEKVRLQIAVGKRFSAIEHIGSTSVENLAAKPIIDMMAAAKIADVQKDVVAPLESIGYVYKGENGIAGRHYFSLGEPRTHHLHVVELDGDIWRRHLRFRDVLRQNPKVVARYAELKHDLARRFPFDRESYTDGKAEFIESVSADFA